MKTRETAETRDAAQRESDHDRWADDGGLSPEPDAVLARAVDTAALRTPLAAVGIALVVGLAFGWVIRRR